MHQRSQMLLVPLLRLVKGAGVPTVMLTRAGAQMMTTEARVTMSRTNQH